MAVRWAQVAKKDVKHVPVLLKAVLEVIAPKPGMVVVDCTVGLGGHSAAILKRLGRGDEAGRASSSQRWCS